MQAHPSTLNDWLARLESMHPKAIDMGLERVAKVKRRLKIRFECPVITVGGTNGKGSTCAMLESILRQADYRVGLYTSPHLLRFNERVRINGEAVEDAALVAAFEAIEAQRGEISLTYFEFTTLAAMRLFAAAGLDAVVLEVGLGGRLDAVNVIDADVAVVTSIDIDHTDYLGSTREQIGFEKAGIFRSGRTAICGDPKPPVSLVRHAQSIGADLRMIGRDFRYARGDDHWDFSGRIQSRESLAYPGLRGAIQLLNAATALAALEALAARLPVTTQQINAALTTLDLPGRFQVLPGRPCVILDVAHNPQAAHALAENLDGMEACRHTYAVFGAMRDKDIDGVIARLRDRIDYWCVTDLDLPRAASALEIAAKLVAAGVRSPQRNDPAPVVSIFPTPADAYADAASRASENDRIVVFGSFLTVAGVMAFRSSDSH
jgi:dihydrofolate synthase/folylpolyglutamate synthase